MKYLKEALNMTNLHLLNLSPLVPVQVISYRCNYIWPCH